MIDLTKRCSAMTLAAVTLGAVTLAACGSSSTTSRAASEPDPTAGSSASSASPSSEAGGAALDELWVLATPESDMEDGTGAPAQRFCGAEAETKWRDELGGEPIDAADCTPVSAGLHRCARTEGAVLAREVDGVLRPWAVVFEGSALGDAARQQEQRRIDDFVRDASSRPCTP
jgi:hypothetical protein